MVFNYSHLEQWKINFIPRLIYIIIGIKSLNPDAILSLLQLQGLIQEPNIVFSVGFPQDTKWMPESAIIVLNKDAAPSQHCELV